MMRFRVVLVAGLVAICAAVAAWPKKPPNWLEYWFDVDEGVNNPPPAVEPKLLLGVNAFFRKKHKNILLKIHKKYFII